MSRIFEALQRAEADGPRNRSVQPAAIAEEVALLATEPYSRNPLASDFGQFPTMHVSVLPEGRLVSLTDRESLGAEKFRFLGVRLRQLQQARKLKRVLVTSTNPEEGKSVVSANLAITLARKQQQRVLLLEGDLRRPVLARRFGLGRLAGLCEWLESGGTTLPNIYHLEEPGIWFLPAGAPPENPLELMQSGRLAELLEQLSNRFDWIVVDTPPILPLADTSVWMRFVDGALLVAREGKTEKRQLKRGLEALEPSSLLGLVLNSCTSTDHSDYYERYGPASPALKAAGSGS